MSENTVEEALHNFGLTEKETQIYIFLAKHGAQGAGKIASGTKTATAVIYRTLKALQRKGFAESTLESPVRYTAVPFENVLDSNIRGKQEEVRQMENSKRELLTDWSKISIGEPEYPLEKFAVIEGDSKIFAKIFKMVRETKSQLSTVATVTGLMRADRYGIFEAIYSHPLRSRVEFRIITDLSASDLRSARFLKRRLKRSINFRGRYPDLGLRLFPRMIIRDREEVLFFITPRGNHSSRQKDETCLWTNCKALVESFRSIFENLWNDSTEIEEKIVELETGKPAVVSNIIISQKAANQKYEEILRSAKKEIVIMTSAAGVVEHQKKIPILKEGAHKGVSIRIMAPITSGNLKAAEVLSKYGSIRHVSSSWQEIAVVDGDSLFQFNNRLFKEEELDTQRSFENAFYTSDREYVEKAKNTLGNIWSNAQAVAGLTPDYGKGTEPRIPKNPWGKTSGITIIENEYGPISEKAILDKIVGAPKVPFKNAQGEITLLGSLGMAVVRPPDYFNLPEMRISAFHIDKQSSLGSEDMLTIDLWLETPEGFAYVPVATIGDNPQAVEVRRVNLSCTPAGQNSQLVTSDKIYVRVHGNTMFAGWTVPIKLFPKPYTLPPACILFEAFGPLKTGVFKQKALWSPRLRTQTFEFNGFEAFVTFTHPTSKYSGPGTEGLLFRDLAAFFSPQEEEKPKSS